MASLAVVLWNSRISSRINQFSAIERSMTVSPAASSPASRIAFGILGRMCVTLTLPLVDSGVVAV